MSESMLLQFTNRFHGISCAWTGADGAICTDCAGQADRERGIPVEPRTIFPACSISKFVTALCVMKLQEQGAISIDAPVNDNLRTWKLRTPAGTESGATIHDLLCHTAGIEDGEDAFYGHRRSDPDISLPDILEGVTAYNNRPARTEKTPGTAFSYSDAGYCVLQQMIEDVTGRGFAEAAGDIVFDALGLKSTFFASPANLVLFEGTHPLASCYDGDGLPIPGRFALCPDLAASGLWTTPADLLTIALAFLAALNGQSSFLTQAFARRMAAPVAGFPWTGLGLFIAGEDVLMSQGWGENGQCMLKMNVRTGRISAVMTNRNPEVDQEASGVAWLVDQRLPAAD